MTGFDRDRVAKAAIDESAANSHCVRHSRNQALRSNVSFWLAL